MLRLTPREQACLLHAAEDKSVAETSELLCVSEDTVKKHRKSLLRKLHCHTMVGALSTAIHQGLISIIPLQAEKYPKG